MAFNYESLDLITKNVKHFRGDPTRFPTHGNSYRRHNHKCFYVDVINGERVFRIAYGQTWTRHEITKEQYEDRVARNLPASADEKWDYVIQPDGSSQWGTTGEKDYNYYEIKPCELGVMYPDNTFEFTMDASMGQGVRMYFSHWILRGYMYSSSRQGGVLIVQDGNRYPVVKGMRVNLSTMELHSSQSISIARESVNRKKAKGLLAKYDDMFKVSNSMIGNMDGKVLTEIAREVLGTTHDDRPPTNHFANFNYHDHNKLLSDAEKYLSERDYLGSALIYAYLSGNKELNYSLRWKSDLNPRAVLGYEKQFRKTIYRINKPFNYDEVPFGHLPPTEWRYVIKINNEQATQYPY
jgi:hypothetical protein